MQIGIDSFAASIPDPVTGVALSPAERMHHLLQEIELADQVGLDVFGIGEHHRPEFLDSAPPVILAAGAALTKRIRLTSAVTVLSAADPVRVFQQFATLDLISQGRAEIVAGRGSFVESFPLFGLDLNDYDALFAEKLDLLLKIRESTKVHWSGKYRPALNGQSIYPRPVQDPLPIWLGVGGTPASFARAGMLGLPLMVAIIGGEPHRFRPHIELYREAGRRAGHKPEQLRVGLHCIGFLADTTQQAADDFFPGYAHTFTEIGKERGWPPTTRAQFDATRGPTGALIIGDAETVTEKILYINESLGGIARITFQMGVSTLPHAKMMHAIEILGDSCCPDGARGTLRECRNNQMSKPHRCAWAESDPLLRDYHDQEWGVPSTTAEPSGSCSCWRDFRPAWHGSRCCASARPFARRSVASSRRRWRVSPSPTSLRLLADPGIIRSRAKIEATIQGARIYQEMESSGEGFSAFAWKLAGGKPIKNKTGSLPAKTPLSEEISAALKKRGFKFVGPVIVYAWMQASGMVNDHELRCFRRNA